jgi:hypothetical protein
MYWAKADEHKNTNWNAAIPRRLVIKRLSDIFKAATRRRTPKSYFSNTPMFATVAPFVIEGTAQMYRTTPAHGARASKTTLPK